MSALFDTEQDLALAIQSVIDISLNMRLWVDYGGPVGRPVNLIIALQKQLEDRYTPRRIDRGLAKIPRAARPHEALREGLWVPLEAVLERLRMAKAGKHLERRSLPRRGAGVQQRRRRFDESVYILDVSTRAAVIEDAKSVHAVPYVGPRLE